ncbi:CaMBD domain-containing protein [Aphelenchoides bicaudatus]|nr:CaMBD domain-containing protein [Aphelenchoides bicaudatus]
MSDSTAKMRCRQRKQLFQRRNKVCDLSLILGLLGLILVVVDTELTAQKIVAKFSLVSLVLRTLVVSSTIALICTLINYHRIEVKIALIDSGADDWRVALTTERIIKLGIEISICSICPFPGSGDVRWSYFRPNTKIESVQIPLDVMLAIPMYLRAYLLCRFMVLHSRQFQDAATRSIAALNRISMDFRFVIKTMMSDHPTHCLGYLHDLLLVSFLLLHLHQQVFRMCMSWLFTQCERHYDINKNVYNNVNFPPQHYYMNSLWFIMVTFMSIGYGDLVPTTHCGRMLAITTGIVGAGVSSALIAVISRKLELSRAEKHVNNFMMDSKLSRLRKEAAAMVLQHTWFIHRYQRTSNKGDDLRLRQHQRKFLNAINEFRRIKWDQRKLQEKGNSLLDVGKLHNEMHETLWEMHKTQQKTITFVYRQDQFISQIDMLTQRIMELQAVVLGQQQQLNANGQPTIQTGGQTPGTVGSVPGNLSPQGHQFQQPQIITIIRIISIPRAASPQYGQQPKKPPQYQMPTTAITIGDPPTSCFITSNPTPPSGQNSIARNGMPVGSQDTRICGNGGLVHQQRSMETSNPKLNQVHSGIDFDMDDNDEPNATSPLIEREPPNQKGICVSKSSKPDENTL